MRHPLRLGALLLTLAVTGAAPAPAVAQNTDTTIRACVKKKNGAMRLLVTGTKCRKGERRVSWNATGVQGLPGPKGDPGAKGDPGDKGDKGDKGDAGTIEGVPAGGALTGTYPNPMIADGAVGAAAIAAALLDGTPATPTLRSLGTGANQAAAGNDPRLSDQRTPLDGSVTTVKLGNGAVTTAKLADEQIITAKLVNGSVTTPKLFDGAVTASKIADNAVGAAALADNAVDGTTVLDGSLFLADLAYASASATVDVGSVSPNACTSFDSNLIYGMSLDDLLIGRAALPVGLSVEAQPSSTSTFHVFICNRTGVAIDPPSTTYHVHAIR